MSQSYRKLPRRVKSDRLLVLGFWAESGAGNPMGPLYAEVAAVALAARWARQALGRHPLRGVAPLSGQRLGRVLALIGDEIGGDLHFDALAAAAGMSPFHLCRTFKAATGLSPHQFVLLRRVAEAQTLLRRAAAQPIAEIAAECGFAHHSHLTAAFRRAVGTTPKQWRRHQRPA